MNILFVSAILPYPLYSGGQVRIYNLLKALGKKHSISLFAFIRKKSEEEYSKELHFCQEINLVLRGHAWQPGYVFRSVIGEYPLLYASYDNPKMRQEIAKLTHKTRFDIIHIEPSYVWPALPPLREPLVVAEHNIEYQVFERYVAHVQFAPLRPLLNVDVAKHKFWEQKIWNLARRVVTVSESDANIVRNSSATPVSIVPNGVDLEWFQVSARRLWSDDPRCLFVGDFQWMQNRDAVQYLLVDLWIPIKKRYSKARLRIVGRSLTENLKDRLRKEDIEVAGTVEDIRDEYKKADLLIAPIRIGGGTKYKILEAMATGLPVITTTLGASGLDLENNKHILIADASRDYIHALESLTENSNTIEMTRAARRLVETKYSWKTIAEKLDAAWRTAYDKTR